MAQARAGVSPAGAEAVELSVLVRSLEQLEALRDQPVQRVIVDL
jgi:hypothetical protein